MSPAFKIWKKGESFSQINQCDGDKKFKYGTQKFCLLTYLKAKKERKTLFKSISHLAKF